MVPKTIVGLFLLVALNSNCCHGASFNWQRLARRANVRAALASKLDPNFWPTRGRRSDMSQHIFVQKNFENRRQTSDEEGPFWANRGRSLSLIQPISNSSFNEDRRIPEDLFKYLSSNDFKFDFLNNNPYPNEQELFKNGHQITAEIPNISSRSDKTDEGPFWANRGRSISKLEWYNEIQKLLTNEKTKARSTTKDDGPFWANRGRSLDKNELGLTRFEIERLISKLNNRNAAVPNIDAKSEKEVPFWANRGRSLMKMPNFFQRNVLYAEEPGWVMLTQRNGRRSVFPTTSNIADNIDTFWGTRGKRGAEFKPDNGCNSSGNQCTNSHQLIHYEKNEDELNN